MLLAFGDESQTIRYIIERLSKKYYMITKTIIAVAFVLIIVTLGTALSHMIKNKEHPEKLAKALSYRIALSLLLFLFLFIAILTGLLKPHGIDNKTQPSKSENSDRIK